MAIHAFEVDTSAYITEDDVYSKLQTIFRVDFKASRRKVGFKVLPHDPRRLEYLEIEVPNITTAQVQAVKAEFGLLDATQKDLRTRKDTR